MNQERVRQAYKMEPFVPMNMELLLMHYRVKRFRIKKMEDIKAGHYVNLRATSALENMITEDYLIGGKPFRSSGSSKYYVFDNVHVKNIKGDWIREETWGACPPQEFAKRIEGMSNKRKRKEGMHPAYVKTLIVHNTLYRDNMLVREYVKMLQNATRFEQYCLINNAPHTPEQYRSRDQSNSFNQQMDELQHNDLMECDYYHDRHSYGSY